MPLWRFAVLSLSGEHELVPAVASGFHLGAPVCEKRRGHAMRSASLFGCYARHIDVPLHDKRTWSACAGSRHQRVRAGDPVRCVRYLRCGQNHASRLEGAARRSVSAAVSLRCRGLRNEQQPDVRRFLHVAHRLTRHRMYLVYESPCEWCPRHGCPSVILNFVSFPTCWFCVSPDFSLSASPLSINFIVKRPWTTYELQFQCYVQALHSWFVIHSPVPIQFVFIGQRVS